MLVRGEQEQYGVRQHESERARCLQPVHLWHGEIENDKIRGKMLSLRDGLGAIRSFAANDKRGLRRKQTAKLPSHCFMIVHDQHGFRHERLLVTADNTSLRLEFS